jgi:hypothetical protein
VEGGRAARPRPCGWEPLAGLATFPPHWYSRDPRLRRWRPGQKRRTQDRGFAKSEHMTPSSVSSALLEYTPHGPLIISCRPNRLFWIT